MSHTFYQVLMDPSGTAGLASTEPHRTRKDTMNRMLKALLAVGLTAVLLTLVSSPASAATSYARAYWNDQPVATAWFNSGTSNMSKGPNSFTLKAEHGSSQATLWFAIGSGGGQTRSVYGSNAEVSFSVAPSPTSAKQVAYGVCGIYSGHRVCSSLKYDTIR